jgi:DNA-binding NarL/FixJ family response regulator
MEKIRVLVVDDHTIVRDGICALLNLSEDIDLVGEATNGKEALETLKTIVPDVILMDIAMPIMGGLETTRRIRKDYPKIKIIILTQYDDKEYVYPAIKAGANGFISKCAETCFGCAIRLSRRLLFITIHSKIFCRRLSEWHPITICK